MSLISKLTITTNFGLINQDILIFITIFDFENMLIMHRNTIFNPKRVNFHHKSWISGFFHKTIWHPWWVMPRKFMMSLYFCGVFSHMPNIHDDAEFLYSHIIVIPRDFSLYTGYNCRCPSSSQLLNFENGCKVSLDFISQNFWFMLLRFYLGP